MFLSVSVRHVGAHPDEHQHGVSIQISINLGKTFLRISRIRNSSLTRNLARVFAYFPPFISQNPDFIYWTVLIFILIYFEARGTENQRYKHAKHEPILKCAVHQLELLWFWECSDIFQTLILKRFYLLFDRQIQLTKGKNTCLQYIGILVTIHSIVKSSYQQTTQLNERLK